MPSAPWIAAQQPPATPPKSEGTFGWPRICDEARANESPTALAVHAAMAMAALAFSVSLRPDSSCAFFFAAA